MKKVFENNPNLKEVWITSDGTPFYTENAAKNHGKTLKDSSVKYEQRPVEETSEDDRENELNALKKDQVVEIATEMELDFDAKTNKGDLIAMILEAETANAEN